MRGKVRGLVVVVIMVIGMNLLGQAQSESGSSLACAVEAKCYDSQTALPPGWWVVVIALAAVLVAARLRRKSQTAK